MGKILVYVGIILLTSGLLIQLVGKLPWVGRLPGDIYIKRGPMTFYFPIITSLLFSLIVSLLLSLFWRK